jgi:hypothetical protein
MSTVRLLLPSLASLLALPACLDTTGATETAGVTTGSTGDASTSTTDTPTSTGSSTGDEPLPPADVPAGCNPIAYAADCMLPYPSDFYLVADMTLPGGVRVQLTPEAAPKTKAGVALDNLAADPADGFSHHQPILALFPEGIDTTDLNFHTDGGDATLTAASPTILLNTDTGELVPHWVELDAMTDDPAKQAFIVRPFVRLDDGVRYIVAFQGLVSQAGAPIDPPLGFAHILRGDVAGHPVLEPLAARYEADIFPALKTAGIGRDGLQLAWDFTTATDERNTADMLRIREDLISKLSVSGPPAIIDKVLYDVSEQIAFRVEGRIEVPLYLEADEPMSPLHRGADGRVEANGTTMVDFTLQVPVSIYPADENFEPRRIIQYGHGFFGEREEINWSAMRQFSNERGFVMASTQWTGMALEDQPDVIAAITNDPANVFAFTDRLHQGFANQIALSYALKTTIPDSQEVTAFKKLIYDPEQLYWYGISQGSIFGLTIMALSPVIEKAVLDVGGGPYSLMMTRSGSFSDLFAIMKSSLGDDPLMIQKFISLSQHNWDAVDPLTWAPRVLKDPPEGAPARKILFSYGVGDHSVNNLASHMLLRAAGIDLLDPPAQPAWGVGTVTAPAPASAGLVVDFKFGEVVGIDAKIPPKPDDDKNVHEAVRRNGRVKDTIDAFLKPGGQIEAFCDGPCDPE